MSAPASAQFRVVVPARYASTRFPGKALADLAGRPMLAWVHDVAQRSGAHEVVVATDDERIARAAHGFGAQVEITRADHPSGSDRIAEVAARRRWPADAIVVNLQGDEPAMPAALPAQVAALLARHAAAAVATLATPIDSLSEFMDPNCVKVVSDDAGRALYFSRAPIPFARDAAAQWPGSLDSCERARRHLGIYAYRVSALQRLCAAAPAALETIEKLEQLRALALGLEIRIEDAVERPGPDVNTPEDLRRAAARIARG